MLNYFNFKPFGEKILVTNDTGAYQFLTNGEFRMLVNDNVTDEPLKAELSKDWFITKSSCDEFCDNICLDMRKAKSHLLEATSLFIFVVTTRCNSKCLYCQAQSERLERACKDMTLEIARAGVDIAMQSPSQDITIEFQGGEPLLNFEAIKEIVRYSKVINTDKNITFALVSNLLLLSDEIAAFIKNNEIGLSTSLDGNAYVHDLNRPLAGGSPTYKKVVERISALAGSDSPVGAIQTTTRHSLRLYKEIVNSYVALGLKQIFIRPLTPLGFAESRWGEIGYTADEFVEFYERSLNYILQLNKNGVTMQEGHAKIWLKKIIGRVQTNYMELRSPCGGALGQMAFFTDGNVFICDEARMLSEMGSNAFCIGNVYTSNYSDLIESDVTKATAVASLLEALPSCSDCVYQPYCGVCPVINLALEGNIFARSAWNYRCKTYYGMLTAIFKILQNNNEKEMRILEGWL